MASKPQTDRTQHRKHIMTPKLYDVTLYWHDGGSIYLNTVTACSPTSACAIALRTYKSANSDQAREIEYGGHFDVIAQLAED